MTSMMWRAPARASVCGPAGWVPVERLEVVRTGGSAYVRVESTPVAPDADLDALVAAAEVEGVIEEAPATVLGTSGRRRTATWVADSGDTMRATIRYAIHGGRLVVLTAVTPDSVTTLAEEAEAILDSVRFAVPDVPDREALPLRSAVPGELLAASTAWLTPRPAASPPTFTITSEEALAAARHYGVTLIPGTDIAVLENIDVEIRDTVLAVAWRSLVARGALTDPELREALEISASHDLLVTVTTEDASTWFAARPDRTVIVIDGTRPSELLLAVHDTAELAELVLAATAASIGPVQLRSAYRVDGRVAGEILSWHQSAPSADGRPSRSATDGAELSELDIRGMLPTLLPAAPGRPSGTPLPTRTELRSSS